MLVVNFARECGLPVTVLSSGHCYVGRSGGNHTFHINMAWMKGMEANLDDPESDTGSSVTVETGNAWGDIYEYVGTNVFYLWLCTILSLFCHTHIALY